jgi:hypothetical protein
MLAALAGVGAVRPEEPAAVSRPKAKSRADWKRSSGFFSRQWRTMRSRTGLRAPLLSAISGGSSFRIAVIVSAVVSR